MVLLIFNKIRVNANNRVLTSLIKLKIDIEAGSPSISFDKINSN